jgi:5-methyltetrahydrofolate--homocysteine methyltransferase
VTPEEFAAAAKRIQEAGVHILGGCCGTAPAFIAALAAVLK